MRYKYGLLNNDDMIYKSTLQSSFEDLTSDEFESLVASVWSAMGWSTEVTSTSHDRGIDIIATKSDVISRKVVIQAKCYSDGNNVGRPDIQQYNTLKQQEPDADAVIVVTSSDFTEEALSLKERLDVKYVNGSELAEAVIEHLPEDKIAEVFTNMQNPPSEQSPTSEQKLSLDNKSDSVEDLEEKYKGYFERLMNDIQKGKPNRMLYFHLDDDYDENRIYTSVRGTKGERKYTVQGAIHNIKFQSGSPDIWLMFQKTCKKYGWEIIARDAIGEGDGGIRLSVRPEKADTFYISVDTGKYTEISSTRQAQISSMILKNVFDEAVSGIRVSDGVCGHNVNRHSRVIE